MSQSSFRMFSAAMLTRSSSLRAVLARPKSRFVFTFRSFALFADQILLQPLKSIQDYTSNVWVAIDEVNPTAEISTSSSRSIIENTSKIIQG